MAESKKRVLLNNDYYNIFQVTPPVEDQDIYDAVDKVVATQVDTLCIDVPPTITDDRLIDHDLDAIYQHPDSDACIRNLHALAAAGKDPYAMLLQRAKQKKLKFIASMRMNDTHYKEQPFNPFVEGFYYDHLKDRLSPNPQGRTDTEYDYRQSAVRNRYLDIARTVLERYDVDGLELNFTRNCRFFPQPYAEECAPIMTQFVRDIRKLLDKAGKLQKKKMELVALVPYNLYTCRKEGLDLPAWARLGLVNTVALSSPFHATFDHDIVDAKVKLPGVDVLGGCDRNMSFSFSGSTRVVPMHTYRAMAANYLQQGADGIHLFNVMSWTMNFAKANAMTKRHGGQGETVDDSPIDYDRNLMDEVGSLKTLEHRDKLYIYAPGRDSRDGSLPIHVPAMGEVTVTLSVGDDIAAAAKANKIESIELQAISSDCDDYNNYTLKLNSIDLARQYAFTAYAEAPPHALLFHEPAWRGALPDVKYVRRHPVRAIDLQTGVNRITIKSWKHAMTVVGIELAIRYRHAR
jgi:hypothetical protein